MVTSCDLSTPAFRAIFAVVLEPITLEPNFFAMKGTSPIWFDMAVAGKDKIGFGYYACDSLFIGFPFSTQDRFATRKKRVDEYDCLSVANLPTCVAQPLENDALFLGRMVVWHLTD